MYRHTFAVIFNNEQQRITRIVPMLCIELPFFASIPTRVSLASEAMESELFNKLVDSLQSQDFALTNSIWSVEPINKDDHETPQEKEQ